MRKACQRREKNFQLENADDKRVKGYKLARNKICTENQTKASRHKMTEAGTHVPAQVVRTNITLP